MPVRLHAATLCWSFLLLAGCKRAPAAEVTALLCREKFDEAAEVAGRWVAEEPADPTAHLLLGVGRYLGGRYPAFAAAREKAPSPPAGLDRLAAFQIPPDEKCPPAMRAFLRGALAELRGEVAQAAAAYDEAARAEPRQPLFRYSWAAAVSDRKETIDIPRDEPLTYAGLMSPSAIGNWVPVRGIFTVTGGKLKTSVGDCSFSATFGAWEYLVAKDGRQVGWAPLLTQGEVIVPATGRPDADRKPPAKPLEAEVKTQFEPLPFDFGNRFFLVRPGSPSGTAFPVILTPLADDGRDLVLATSLVTSTADLLPSTRMGEGSFFALDPAVDSPKAGVKANLRAAGDSILLEETAFLYHRVVEKAAFGAMTVQDGRAVFTGADLVREVGRGRVFSQKKK